ncbi:hypothetical protein, partial [Planktosalinus lacus]|uniref:hypothetical protein n=1 Tax=Planktosalinus lacus TaxID=1526573 RepID=UPI001E2F9FC1
AEKLSVPSILALIIKWKTTIFMDNKLNIVNIRAETVVHNAEKSVFNSKSILKKLNLSEWKQKIFI